MDKRLERILPRVQKPARYVGGEYNAVKKDPARVDTRIAFCFPDTYEIGMSNLGMRILYGVMNNMEGVWCQRVFAPWGDMEEEMRRAGMPLFALESGQKVYPVAMINTNKANPIGTWIPRPARCGVYVGDPIDPDDFRDAGDDYAQARALTDAIMEALHELSGQEYVKDFYAADVKKSLEAGKGYPPGSEPRS